MTLVFLRAVRFSAAISLLFLLLLGIVNAVM
jgi:hypothetical protein